MNNIDETKFIEAFKLFSAFLKFSIKVSKLCAGRITENDCMYWACLLFTRLCVLSTSLKKLSDHTVKGYKEHWDYASTFSMTRNIMECYQTLFYLCFDDVSEDEQKARKYLFNVHDYYSRKKILQKEDIELENFVINQLKSTAYFQNLSEKLQKDYLKGEKAFFVSREDIDLKEGFPKENWKIIYKLLSANTHSFPLGFYRMVDASRGTGVFSETECSYTCLSLILSTTYLYRACTHMIDMFPDISDKMLPLEQKLVNSLMDNIEFFKKSDFYSSLIS